MNKTRLLSLLLASLPACTYQVVNEEHCQNNEGDAYCAQLNPDRPFCNSGQRNDECDIGHLGEEVALIGCVSAEELKCHEPCGKDPTCEGGDESSSSGGETETTTDGSGSTSEPDTDTEEPTSTTGPECMGNEECMDAALPFCVDEVCSPCSAVVEGTPDEACAGLDDATPLCVDDACVQCTAENFEACGGATPLCDAEENTCAGCRFHEECQAIGSPACNVATGACFDSSAASVTEVNVGTDGAIQPAIDAVADGGEHAIVLTGTATGDHGITVDGGKTIAIVSTDANFKTIDGNEGNPTVTVTGAGTTVYLHRLALTLNGDDVGISVESGATLYADSVRVAQNTGGGVELATGTSGFLRNCMVGGANNSDAIASSGSLDLLYTTVVGNFGASSTALSCSGGTTDVRNCILASRSNDAVDCAAATITTSLEAEGGAYQESWFDLDGGDLTLAVPADFANVAIWEGGDPPFDFDGDARPNTDGANDYPGADVP